MDNLTIVEKAYEIDFSKVEEGFLYSDVICYAENINQAKSKLLSETKYENIIVKKTSEEANYLTIPVIRCKEADKVLFDKEIVPRSAIDSIIKKKEKLNKLDLILNDSDVTHCYIKKGGWYYRDNNSGYTEYLIYAGVYSKHDAVKSAKHCDELTIVPINSKEHNDMIYDAMKKLENRLIMP